MAHLLADIPQKALIEHDGRVLVIFDAVKKDWELPGGRVEEGEESDLAGALKREIREELGVEISVGELLDAFIFIGDKPHCVFIYKCHLLGDPAGIKIDGLEVGEVRWIGSPHEVSELRMLSGYKKIINRYFRK